MISTRNFFHSILNTHTGHKIEKLVIVTHLVPGSEMFLLAINETIPIAALIPKPNSIDKLVMNKMGRDIPILNYTRQQIKSHPGSFLRNLKTQIGDSSFAVIDTGGYFSHILYDMQVVFHSKLVGIVEDTENGHQKYEALLAQEGGYAFFPCPVISVARSTLKDPEDFLVGQAIVFSAEALLREQRQILTGKRAVVLGYGKIGRSIAQNLQSKAVRVDVYDTNPSRQVLALAHGYHTDEKDHLLACADLVFCATGNRSLKRQDMANLKRDAYVFTATSGDDEIEDHHSVIEGARLHSHPKISVVELNGNRFFLCNNGNSVNFLHGGVIGPFINLVQAELLFVLSQFSSFPTNRVSQLSDESKRFIADLWLEHFITG